MREFAKMATGLAAKSGFGPWLRGVLFVGMAACMWQLWLWLARPAYGPLSDIIVLAVSGWAGVNLVAVLAALVEGGLADRGLRGAVRWLPLAMWAEMTDDGEDVRLWAILAWPLLLPAEMAVCAVTPVVAVAAVVVRALNVRVK